MNVRTPQPGDILWQDKNGKLHCRPPTDFEKFKWKYVYPMLGVALFPVRLVHELYWTAYHHRRRHEKRCMHGIYMADACGLCGREK